MHGKFDLKEFLLGTHFPFAESLEWIYLEGDIRFPTQDASRWLRERFESKGVSFMTYFFSLFQLIFMKVDHKSHHLFFCIFSYSSNNLIIYFSVYFHNPVKKIPLASTLYAGHKGSISQSGCAFLLPNMMSSLNGHIFTDRKILGCHWICIYFMSWMPFFGLSLSFQNVFLYIVNWNVKRLYLHILTVHLKVPLNLQVFIVDISTSHCLYLFIYRDTCMCMFVSLAAVNYHN